MVGLARRNRVVPDVVDQVSHSQQADTIVPFLCQQPCLLDQVAYHHYQVPIHKLEYPLML